MILRNYCFIFNDSCFFRAFRRIVPCHPWIQHWTSADSVPSACFLPEKADTAPGRRRNRNWKISVARQLLCRVFPHSEYPRYRKPAWSHGRRTEKAPGERTSPRRGRIGARQSWIWGGTGGDPRGGAAVGNSGRVAGRTRRLAQNRSNPPPGTKEAGIEQWNWMTGVCSGWKTGCFLKQHMKKS